MTRAAVGELVPTGSGDLCCEDAAGRRVWRVGYAPDPWSFTPWQYAVDGRFTGRWDDPVGVWRSLYVGADPLACFLEVLAPFRADPQLAGDLADIREDPADTVDHPTAPAGVLPAQWVQPRLIGSAALTGWFAVPGNKESLPTLRARFLPMAVDHHLPDLDAAAIRIAEPRAVTQAIGGWIYEQADPAGDPIGGVRFESRHGDGLRLWALFERPGDGPVSRHISGTVENGIDVGDSDLVEAMRIHRLRWEPPPR